MEKATPVQIRQSLELADYLKRAGIRFVPIPVFDDDDWIEQAKEFKRRVEKIIETDVIETTRN